MPKLLLSTIYWFLFLSSLSYSAQAQTIDYTLYTQGIGYKNARQYKAAINSFSQFIQQYPSTYPKVYWERGNIYYHLRRYNDAADDYGMLCELDPKHTEGFFSWGLCLVTMGFPDLALSKFDAALEIDPRHAGVYNERGMIKFHRREYDSALEDFYKAVEIDSTFSQACNNAGAARYFNQNIARPTRRDIVIARQWFDRAIKVDSNFVLALRNRATMDIILKDYDHALSDLQRAKQLSPKDQMTFLFIGVLHADQQQVAPAVEAFEHALALDPQLAIAYEELGNLYKDQESYGLAVEYYQKAQAVQPPPDERYVGLMDYRIALIQAQQGLKKEAITSLRKAHRQNTFRDRRVYQDFQKAKEFRYLRSSKAFQKLTKSISKGEKNNHFLQPGLGWFRMRKN